MVEYLLGLSKALAGNYFLFIFLVVLSFRKKLLNKMCIFLFFFWAIFLFWLTVFSRGKVSFHPIEFRPFHDFYVDEYMKNITTKETLINFANNILLFIPCGLLANILLCSCKHGLLITILTGFCISLVVELCQYFIPCGLCEIDDLTMNSFGAAIGAGISKYTICKINT